MRPLGVDVDDSRGNLHARMAEPEKQALVQEFIAHSPVKRFNEGILDRFTRRDVSSVGSGLRRRLRFPLDADRVRRRRTA